MCQCCGLFYSFCFGIKVWDSCFVSEFGIVVNEFEIVVNRIVVNEVTPLRIVVNVSIILFFFTFTINFE